MARRSSSSATTRFDSRDFFATQRADAEAAPVRRQPRRAGRDEPDVLLRRLRGSAEHQGAGEHPHAADSEDAAGDFSELLPTQIYDPDDAAARAFPGNIIPQNRLDPIALQYMALLPANTNGGLANNYQTHHDRCARTATRPTAASTIGSTATTRCSCATRTTTSTRSPRRLPMPTGRTASSPVCRGGRPAFPGRTTPRPTAMQANYVRVFSPTLIGEFKGGYVKAESRRRCRPTIGPNASQTVRHAERQHRRRRDPGLATDDGHRVYAARRLDVHPAHHSRPHAAINAIVTKTAGAHNIKMGGGVILRRVRACFRAHRPVGDFDVQHQLTDTQLGDCGRQCHRVVPARLSHALRREYELADSSRTIHTNEPSVFVQDDWRATRG